jgi:glycosyltransferase involved in cell wall biosynthesis
MKVLIRQFLGGKSHSWAICGYGIARGLLGLGHQVDLFSTDGTGYLPKDLEPYLIGYTEENKSEVHGRLPDAVYDAQISYTCMKNFPYLLRNGNQNRFGIWVWEWAGRNSLPTGFAKHYKSCDYLCPPSQFGKQVFMDSGVPESGIKVIPHGIDAASYQKTSTIVLPTQKRFKLLANIAQSHRRKNIPGLLEAYGKAFTDKDDVCLILKAKDKPVTMAFEVSLKDCLARFYQQFPKHAEVKVFSEYVDDISDLYRSVDATFTMTNAEGFYFPALEARASGKLSIAPGWGGQLDLLNDSNALLIGGKEERADPRSIYWESKPSIWFQPSIDDAVEKLRYAYQNYEKLNSAIDKQRNDVYATYDWKVIAQQFMSLCK